MSTPQAATAGDGDSAPPIGTVTGTESAGFKGDGEPAVSAQVNRPYGIALDSVGTLYFSDQNNNRVRKITTDGKISTVAGTGVAGSRGDNGPAVAAQLNRPRAVAVDGDGNLFIADDENHRVRKVSVDGTISTVAGTGVAGFKGDGGPATSAQLNKPLGVVVDGSGVLYVAEWGNDRIRKITTDGKISTIAGTGAASYGGDGGPAVSAHLRAPYAMVVDDAGALYIADASNHRVRKVSVDGRISTVAGTGVAGFKGDGGPATTAQLNEPNGLAVDCVDTLYIADHLNSRIRKISSERLAGLPDSGAVVSWANVRSRLRMGVRRESLKDGAEVHQDLTTPRNHQRWRLIAVGQEGGEVLYRIENVRSGKVLEVAGAQETAGAVIAQRAYEGGDAHHQQWRLIPAGPVTEAPRVFEIANRNSGLLLRVDTNARTAVEQYGAEGDHRGRQWQLLPV